MNPTTWNFKKETVGSFSDFTFRIAGLLGILSTILLIMLFGVVFAALLWFTT